MAPWLDIAIVVSILSLALVGIVRIFRKPKGACASGCTSCGPTEPAAKLVHIGAHRR